MATLSAARTRAYTQKVTDPNSVLGNLQFPDVTNASTSTAAGYVVSAWITSRPTEIISTTTHAAAQIRLYRFGNGTSVAYDTRVFVQFSVFATDWTVGDILRVQIVNNNVAPALTDYWDLTIPDNNTSALTITTPQPMDLWPVITGYAPNAATLGTPTGSGQGYAGQTLGWTAGAVDATHEAATGYKVYFGTANPPTTLVQNNATLAYVTGALAQNTTYYAKVVAYNVTGDAAALTWNFTTRSEMNPTAAILTAPVEGSTLTTVWPATALDVVLTWTAGAGVTPTGYKLAWDGGALEDIGNVLTVTKTAVAARPAVYTWQVVPYYVDGGAKSVRLGTPVVVRATANAVRGDGPAANGTFYVAAGAAPTYTVEVTSVPTGATIWVNGVETADIAPHTYTLTAGDDVTYAVQMANYDWVANPVGSNVIVDIAANTTVNFVGTYHNVDLVNPGFQYIGEPGVAITGVAGNTTVYTTPIAPSVGAVVMTFTGTVTADLTIVVPAGIWFAVAYYSGAWHTGNPFPVAGPGVVVFMDVPFGAKADVPVIIDPSDLTLPVELSSFSAVLTAEYFVNLTWVTESETQVNGFNVYRSEDATYANAVRVNASLIGATNTSEQHVYSLTDSEVTTNTTYYYWLENVDMSGVSNLYGPQSVTVTGNPIPVLPEISMIRNAYPNPFRAGTTTNLEVSVKAGETGTVTVYNILGQAVKTFKVTEGNHKLTWDGKNCGSGIYFYKLSTPSTNSTKKLVIVK
jgi:hypothetical protein